jgi:hypothetical protein
MGKTTLIALILFLAAAVPLDAQVAGDRTTRPVVPLSFLSSASFQTDTISVLVTEDSLSAPYKQTKSTLLAMGLSAVLPGAGQIYNESYWKAPIIMGIGGWLVYEWIQSNNFYKDYRDQYQASIATNAQPALQTRLLTIREFYHDQRDGFAWYLGLLYAINILDAYVDASLFDFRQDARVTIKPFPQPTGMAINFKYSF